MTAQHFLVPLDWSPDADQALVYAIDLARACNARLTLLHILQPAPMAAVDVGIALPESYFQALEADAQQHMEAALARVTEAGLTGESVVRYGVPFQVIVDTAQASHIDLIIMGTHGRTGLRHILLGSVAERVVRLAPCGVLVVRHAVKAEEPSAQG